MGTIEQIDELIKQHSVQATKETIIQVQEIIVAGNEKIYKQVGKIFFKIKDYIKKYQIFNTNQTESDNTLVKQAYL